MNDAGAIAEQTAEVKRIHYEALPESFVRRMRLCFRPWSSAHPDSVPALGPILETTGIIEKLAPKVALRAFGRCPLTPESGHRLCSAKCLLSANRGHQGQFYYTYSGKLSSVTPSFTLSSPNEIESMNRPIKGEV